MSSNVCGCYFSTGADSRRRYLPQVQLEAHATIIGSTCRTTLTQTFLNPDSALQEICYAFPLYDGVGVVAFTCTVGSRVIRGVVKEKRSAREAYDDAVARGETAGLLERVPEAADVFTTSIGNVPAGARIRVDIVYLGELKHDMQVDGVRLTIPTNIAPRYGSYPGQLVGAQNILDHGMKITIDAETSSPESKITVIQSPSHHVVVTLGKTSRTSASEEMSFQRASATLTQSSTGLERDFVLQVVIAEVGKPVALLETHPTIPDQQAIMATLVPRFDLATEKKPEVVFVCDRSGSMGSEGRIANLKAALRLFVKSLPIDARFNICSFGSHHNFLWDRSRAYDKASVDEAMVLIDTFDANYGGTEMYTPIADTFARRYTDLDLEVFLLTDGAVWDQSTLIGLVEDLVSESSGAIRVFTLGIGSDVSHALVEGIARAGNGFSQAVTNNEEMSSKVVRMLKGALFPHVLDYSLEVKYEAANNRTGDDEEEEDKDFVLIEKVLDGLNINVGSTSLQPSSDESTNTPSIQEEKGKHHVLSLYDPSSVQEEVGKDETMECRGGNQDADRYSHVPSVEPPKLLQAPFRIPTLVPFNRTTIYLLLSPSSSSSDTRRPKSVILRGTTRQGQQLELEIPIVPLAEKAETIHQLAARKAVGDLEEGRGWIFHARDAKDDGILLKEKYDSCFNDMVQREAVRLGVKYQVGGKWCSFVAVEESGNDDDGKNTRSEKKAIDNSFNIVQDDDSFRQAMMVDRGIERREASGGSGLFGSPITAMRRSKAADARTRKSGFCDTRCTSAESGSDDEAPARRYHMRRSLNRSMHSVLRKTVSSRRASPSSDFFETQQLTGPPAPPPAAPDQAPATIRRIPAITREWKPIPLKPISVQLPEPKQAAEYRLQQLVMLQSFGGSWEASEHLFNLLGLDENLLRRKLEAGLRSGRKCDEGNMMADLLRVKNVLATVCVIIWLRGNRADKKDVWELLVDKAIQWLEERISQKGGSKLLSCGSEGLVTNVAKVW